MQVSELALFADCSQKPVFLTELDKVQIPKLLYKVWSGYTKFIRHYISKNKVVNTPQLGQFIPQGENTVFKPNQAFLAQGKFKFRQGHYNTQGLGFQQLSYAALSHACGLQKDLCFRAVKEIFKNAVLLTKQGKKVKLNLKVGWMALFPGMVEFQSVRNNVRETGNDQSSALSPLSSRCTKTTRAQQQRSFTPVPWPYLSAFYENSSPVFQKKMSFGPQVSAKELLEHHRIQMIEKQKRQLQEKKIADRINSKLVKKGYREIAEENKIVQQIKQKEKETLVKGNQKQILDKLERSQNTQRVEEYFPFTHGDVIENQRKEVAKRMREQFSKLSPLKRERGVSVQRETSVPSFMKPSQRYTVRKVNPINIRLVMKQANQRYIEEMKKLDNEKQVLNTKVQGQFQRHSKQEQTNLSQKQKVNREYLDFLQKQIQQKHDRKQKQNKILSTSLVMANNDQLYQKKVAQKQILVNKELRKQIKVSFIQEQKIRKLQEAKQQRQLALSRTGLQPQITEFQAPNISKKLNFNSKLDKAIRENQVPTNSSHIMNK